MGSTGNQNKQQHVPAYVHSSSTWGEVCGSVNWQQQAAETSPTVKHNSIVSLNMVYNSIEGPKSRPIKCRNERHLQQLVMVHQSVGCGTYPILLLYTFFVINQKNRLVLRLPLSRHFKLLLNGHEYIVLTEQRVWTHPQNIMCVFKALNINLVYPW